MAEDFWTPIWLSLKIAFIAAIITLIIGLFFSKWMVDSRRKKRAIVIELILIIPLVLPPSVTGLILITIFGNNSMIGQYIQKWFGSGIMFTPWAGVLAAIVVTMPLMYQSLKLGLSAIDEDVKGAAKVDGAGRWNLFWGIEVPLATTYIMSGFIMSFARGMGEFGATLMFAGNIPGKTQTASTAIYTAIEIGDIRDAWVWAGMLIFFSFLLLLTVQLIGRKK